MQRTTIDFGIDLGTTNSTIAVIDGTGAKPIPNKGGSIITPSAVWMDKRGNLHVGVEAKLHALVDDMENGDLEFKLRMGLGAEGKKVFRNSGREMTPEALSAEVLKSLKMDVQSTMGEQVITAVVTVPAAFELPQTNATQKAAELAGFTRCPLLLEPVAASLAYGFQSKSENVYWLVYDFGGGTFDAAVMRIRDGLIQVVNHDGDNHLGGKLIDWDLVTRKLAPVLTEQYNLPDFRRNNPKWASTFGKLKYYAEQAKIEVCRTKSPSEIWIDGLCEDVDGRIVDFNYTLTPADVEQVSKPYIESSLRLCRKTLQEKGLAGSDMERILMVGGSTLNPWVRDAVEAGLGGKLEFGIDPVTVVARGAAIYASTQPLPPSKVPLSKDVWRIDVEHEPVGNVSDPDIGGRLVPPNGQNPDGFTIEFVDTKTKWRTGRIRLGVEGIFMTQLFADVNRRCEYSIEFCDSTGTKIATSPMHLVYTIGVVPDKPPASNTIGVGLANDEVAVFIRKGTKLPARGSSDFRSTVTLRAGKAEDKLRISVIEGENAKATRNHGIGELIIKGTDVKRELPAGSKVEVTLVMDESQEVRVLVYVSALGEDFELKWDLKMKHDSLEELQKEVLEQKKRVEALRENAGKTNNQSADVAILRIEDEQLIDQVDSLIDAAEHDQDALSQLDRRIRDLTSAIDEVEDAVEWPLFLEKAAESRKDTEAIVNQFGEESDKKQFRALDNDCQKAITMKDLDLLRHCIDEFDTLYFEVLNRLPEYHKVRFKNLADKRHLMRDSQQAEQLINQGERAINNDDIDGLKMINRQLRFLLPIDLQQQADRRISDLI